MGDNGRFIKLKKEREGEINYNNFGSKMILIEYRGWEDVDILFPEYNNYIYKNGYYNKFKDGGIKCPLEKNVFNIGYIGVGKYSHKLYPNIYKIWEDMMKRCYSKNFHKKRPTYVDCEVCEEWHNFQNFAKWYEENYYEIEGQKMHLDKDILFKGNKIYSPQTCIFVPQRINVLFVKRNSLRGDLPVGVFWNKKNKKFQAQCQTYEKHYYLGLYNKPFEAFTVYKNFKENYIKQIADEYKNLIPTKLYEALYKYKVEITD